MTAECQNCGQPHRLIYFVDDDGKRKLSYFCNKFFVQSKTGNGDLVQVLRTKRFDLPMREGLPLQEVWSPAWSRKQSAIKQRQLILMVKRHEDPEPAERPDNADTTGPA